MSRDGKARIIGYMDKSVPEIRFQPRVDPGMVLVSVSGLAEAFFKGVDSFLVDIFADRGRASVAERRIESIVHEFPVGEALEDGK